jgi:hypothetical protein
MVLPTIASLSSAIIFMENPYLEALVKTCIFNFFSTGFSGVEIKL